MNLITTCPRHFEDEAREELRRILIEFGDQDPQITKTDFPGILTATTNLNQIESVEKIRKKILEEPWCIRYCLRIIPIQAVCSTNVKKIEVETRKILGILRAQDSYRITIEKRNSKISSDEIISEIAKNIPNKVSLDDPDWIILIEIIGEQTGVSILQNNMILSVEKVKRSLSE